MASSSSGSLFVPSVSPLSTLAEVVVLAAVAAAAVTARCPSLLLLAHLPFAPRTRLTSPTKTDSIPVAAALCSTRMAASRSAHETRPLSEKKHKLGGNITTWLL
ncbi:hypothetical protein Micbo1qcDRAFT_49978 [Microdochium bolleyi]|uniref:Uncharacterized protein n=1 Tax=Microdochium bolleyi TaxID=196109 RepID=A0A136J657_9PEZI|nr:hypothetical protein Micbo1qcDRAFT_49978 [Microdochium bolleyi]